MPNPDRKGGDKVSISRFGPWFDRSSPMALLDENWVVSGGEGDQASFKFLLLGYM